jgi:branched-subunit amino acid transport protein
MSVWVVMAAGGLLTYLLRFSFIYVLGHVELGEGPRRTLRFVAPAVLSAIVLPDLVYRAGELNIGLGNYRLLAGCVAVIVAWRTKSVLATLIVGTLVLVVLQDGILVAPLGVHPTP